MYFKRKKKRARHWGLTPVILPTWEAETESIIVGDQPGQDPTSTK
jgi:hypothetical protein